MLAIAVLLSCTCCHRSEVIPRSDMSKIYTDMFLLDMTIERQRNLSRAADTSRVYAAILEKYGYTEDDFLKSQEVYIKDANRYARMLKKSQARIESELKDLKKERDRLNALHRQASDLKDFIAKYKPDTLLLFDTCAVGFCLSLDSLMGFDFYPYADTVYAGPRVIARDWALLDSLAKAKADSLAGAFAAKADSLAKLSGDQAVRAGAKPDAKEDFDKAKTKKLTGRKSGKKLTKRDDIDVEF